VALLLAAWTALASACEDGAGAGDDAGATADASTTGDDAGAHEDGGADDDGGPGADGGPGCADDGADDAREGARDLGMIDDRSDFPSGTEMGAVSPLSDFDWVTWHVEDVPLADVQPRAELRGLSGGRRMEICAYYACDSTSESVGCEIGTAHELSLDLRGCCTVGTDETLAVKLSPSCEGTDDSGRVYVRVAQQGGAAACEPPYTLAWGDE
jgi:hypothetical protein